MISFGEFLAATDPEAAREPYPWQHALAARLADGEPPRAIVVPTGGGKTVTVEALLWALAVQADRAPTERTVGVRIVWAIDRRILVDEVHDRATLLAIRLGAAVRDPRDKLHEMASRLRSLSGNFGEPLIVTRWRGGLAREARAHHPLQAQIITSTVAQIGSRLLFRGYGVGERSLALEAGLAGVDTTICLDEAHLAEPFRQTVDAISAIRAREPVALPGLRAITLTATPVTDLAPAQAHTVTAADRPVLGTRLTGVKLARLVEPASESAADQMGALLDAVEGHLDEDAMTIACVVNSVRTAIDVATGLHRRRPDVARALLIGPQRPIDRDKLLRRHRGQLFHRERGEAPFVCVATQTFEVGLDADVEAMVTQSASAGAIVQRLGRLNRAGVASGRATIVRDTGSPLYADDEPLAWAWLHSLAQPDGTIDVSVAALMADGNRPAAARSRHAPQLTPAVLDLLVQTAPRPARMADPDVEVFLRGAEEQPSTDVGLCWRCDLRLDDDAPAARNYRAALLRLVPPGREEIVTVSIARAHAVLRAMRAPKAQLAALAKIGLDGPDVEGGDEAATADKLPAASREDDAAPSRFVVLRGREQFEVGLDDGADTGLDLGVRDIRPGDLLVLPTHAGGYADDALAPDSRTEVEDVADDMPAATEATSPRHVIRLSEEALRAAGLEAEPILRRALRYERAPAAGTLAELCGLLGPPGERLRDLPELELRRLTDDADGTLGDLGFDDEPLGLVGDEDDALGGEPLLGWDVRAPGTAFALIGRREVTREELRAVEEPPPTLDAHANAVADRARCFISGSGVPARVASSVVLAARAHDLGKGDPRFQAFFRGGIRAWGAPAIAKSVFGTADLQASRTARKIAGLPTGLRHEIASVAALDGAIAKGDVEAMPVDVDVELALHLVATHHGLGRPVPAVPAATRTVATEFAIQAAGIVATARGDAIEGWEDGAWLRRFLAVVERYGPWGSAYLEAVLMLADRTVSREGG